MQVTIDKARRRPTEYYFRVIVNSDLPEDQQSVEEFTYGLDTPLVQIRAEFLALLRNKYEVNSDIILDYEGDVIEIDNG